MDVFFNGGLMVFTKKPLLSPQGKVEKLAWAARELCELLRVKVEAGASCHGSTPDTVGTILFSTGNAT